MTAPCVYCGHEEPLHKPACLYDGVRGLDGKFRRCGCPKHVEPTPDRIADWDEVEPLVDRIVVERAELLSRLGEDWST